MAAAIASRLITLFWLFSIYMIFDNIGKRKKKGTIVWGIVSLVPVAVIIILTVIAVNK